MTTRGHGPTSLRRHNLPAQPTPLLGRAAAVEAARQLLLRDDVRLLVLDNAEHLLAAIPDLARLLQACLDLTLLVTSRVDLRPRWEHVFAVAPLDVVAVGASASPEVVAATGAVALFGFHLGLVTAIQHGPAATRARYERALALSRESGNAWGIAYSGGGLGHAALAVGDVETADALVRETLEGIWDVGDQFSIQIRLSDLAAVAAAREGWERVLRLEGASSALRVVGGVGTFFVAPADVDARIATARRRLPQRVHAAAWADGLAMSPAEAVAYALAPADTSESTTLVPAPTGTSSPLTPREDEVAALIGRGLSNRQIGEALVISEGTARIHVSHVLAKLGFHSRVQVATWAAERGLLDTPPPDA